MVDSGRAVIGTPDDAVAQIERLAEKSGGFGCLLLLAHNWATFDRTKYSYELFARHALPVVNQNNQRRVASLNSYVENKQELMGKAGKAIMQSMEKHRGDIVKALAAKKAENAPAAEARDGQAAAAESGE
jgi:limonene 1,2-monooxygenase